MSRWADLEREAPELAAGGAALLHQHGLGLGYLATVRADGGPRIHPFCPILCDGGLWGFIGDSPKLRDLRRDRRYAIHSFPSPDRDDEFYAHGRAVEVPDPEVIARVRAAYTAPIQEGDDALFELEIERALLASYGPRPSWPPEYTRWSARS